MSHEVSKSRHDARVIAYSPDMVKKLIKKLGREPTGADLRKFEHQHGVNLDKWLDEHALEHWADDGGAVEPTVEE